MGKSEALEVPVLIAGGGPVGMTLALNLARYGVRSILVERNPTTTRHPKMDLTNGRSMELFGRLNLVEKLRDAGVPRENNFDILWVTNMVGHDLCRFHYPSAAEKTRIIRCKSNLC
jgi:2-polyprenyl-6-methoxyphenol hydroxylase-like FAD-dependent oxidoreductase